MLISLVVILGSNWHAYGTAHWPDCPISNKIFGWGSMACLYHYSNTYQKIGLNFRLFRRRLTLVLIYINFILSFQEDLYRIFVKITDLWIDCYFMLFIVPLCKHVTCKFTQSIRIDELFFKKTAVLLLTRYNFIFANWIDIILLLKKKKPYKYTLSQKRFRRVKWRIINWNIEYTFQKSVLNLYFKHVDSVCIPSLHRHFEPQCRLH